jgi:two-component system phosphate regulon response regulator PhoB
VTKRVQAATTVLIVDDEQDIGGLLGYVFSKEGFRVLSAADGRRALELARKEKPALIILDIMLPEVSGTEVLRSLRADPATRATPVILLTAKKSEGDRIAGLELGADDYVTKPFSPRELLLRARTVLKRGPEAEVSAGEALLKLGPVEIEVDNYLVRVQGKPVKLTPTEFRLLSDLVRAHGRVRLREALLDEVWGYNSEVMSRTIDTHVRRLRRKLGPAAAWLTTVRGIGYRFQDPERE